MEGVWFAYDAATGRPIYQRVKVIDRTEHPTLQPGKEVTVFPSSLGGVNYSPASYDAHDELRLQRRGRDRRRRGAGEADADPEAAQATARRRVPRPAERQLRHGPAGLARPRLDQRDRHRHRPAGLEDHDTGAGARRGHDHRERARLRGRRRRRVPGLRPEDRQGPVDVPDRPPDRRRRVDLLGRRQGVRRDHVRRHADVVGRRHRRASCRSTHSAPRRRNRRRRLCR